MNNLCISYIEGTSYDFSGIKVTFKSLKEHYQGPLVVLYKNIDNKLLNFLAEQNIEAIDCSSYKVTFDTSPYNNKIIYTYLYFKKNCNLLKNKIILFCDISDIYFKCNPFELYSEQLQMFLENKPFSKCECNSTWINVCYDYQTLELIKNNIVINAGLYLSPFNQLFEFLKLITNEMSQIFSKINYPIVEQAIVNKLIYIDNIDCVLNSSDVNNMAQQVKIKADNKINHQYKVFPEIKEKLYSIYAN
jgi:hypothetical protein